MTKNMLHDVMTKRERSIRRIPLPGARRGGVPEAEEDSILYEREEIEVEEMDSPPPWRRILLWGAAAVFVVLLIVALSTSFTGARIRVTPRSERVAVNMELTASRDATGKLAFQALPINETAEFVIPADTVKKVSERATGTIIIYNAFSDKPQRLIKNTRFETPAGLIYRIGASVTVPGKTVKNGRPIPGSVEAVVSADSPGTDYNIALSDFTIPGFKTDPARFAGFYARSKTPLTGGIDGTIKMPSDGAVEAARASLRDSLRQKVAKETLAMVPSGYILFQGALVSGDEPLSTEPRGDGKAAVRERLTGAAYVFKKSDIAQTIARSLVPSYDSLPVEIPNLDSLSFQMTASPTGNLAEVKTLRFSLKGDARIVWRYDEAKLQDALVGKPKGDLAATLASFPTIEKADLVLKPFWSRTFPKNPKQVVIETVPGETAAMPAETE